MIDLRQIPTELLQLFSPQEAATYRLVPFVRENDTVGCYGCEGESYDDASEEIAVLFGFRTEVTLLAKEEFQRLLAQYYRPEGAAKSPTAARLTDIAAGQGFLMSLIGEAFRNYASDIHFEPYENRCRVRLRIDGKLAERYVV